MEYMKMLKYAERGIQVMIEELAEELGDEVPPAPFRVHCLRKQMEQLLADRREVIEAQKHPGSWV